MRTPWLLVLLVLLLGACQDEIYPEAPLVAPQRQTSLVSPSPGASPVAPHEDWVSALNGRYMEFAPAKTGSGRLYFAFFPLDADQHGYPTLSGTGTMVVTDSKGTSQTKPLSIKIDQESFFYGYPGVEIGQACTLDVTIKLSDFTYTGHYTYP